MLHNEAAGKDLCPGTVYFLFNSKNVLKNFVFHFSCHEPVLFTESKDPLGAGFVANNTNAQSDSNHNHNHNPIQTPMPSSNTLTNTLHYRSKPSRPSLARIILSLESNAAKQQALQHILNALQILSSREAVVSGKSQDFSSKHNFLICP